MSLSSILADKNKQELRDKFKIEFPNPGLPFKREMLCPPLTNNYGIVGTAFDYLMRFYVHRINKSLNPATSKWVAEYTLGSLSVEFSSERRVAVKDGKFQIEESEKFNFILNQFLNAKKHFDSYLKNGRITDELIYCVILLAKLDLYHRARFVDPDYSKIDSKDIEDLRAMIKYVNRSDFKAERRVYLNPTFGFGSRMVGGADADMIIDDTLIEIKVTKFLKLEREHLNQLIGYYILSLIGGVNKNSKDHPIKNIGIYFARYGLLWTIPLKSLGTKRKFDEAKEWFIEMVCKKNI